MSLNIKDYLVSKTTHEMISHINENTTCSIISIFAVKNETILDIHLYCNTVGVD